jgi:hypothetical protein
MNELRLPSAIHAALKTKPICRIASGPVSGPATRYRASSRDTLDPATSVKAGTKAGALRRSGALHGPREPPDRENCPRPAQAMYAESAIGAEQRRGLCGDAPVLSRDRVANKDRAITPSARPPSGVARPSRSSRRARYAARPQPTKATQIHVNAARDARDCGRERRWGRPDKRSGRTAIAPSRRLRTRLPRRAVPEPAPSPAGPPNGTSLRDKAPREVR